MLISLQRAEETAEENRLRILRRKSSRHKGVTGFIEQLRATVLCCIDVQCLEMFDSNNAENFNFPYLQVTFVARKTV